jgi:O-antigen ligase
MKIFLNCLLAVTPAVGLGFLFSASPPAALAATGAVIATILIFLNFKHGLYLVILTIPVSLTFFVGPFKVFLQEIFIGLTALSFLASSLIRKEPVKINSFYTPFWLAFALYYLFNLSLVSVDPGKSLLWYFHFLESVALYFLTVNLVSRRPEEKKRLVNLIIFAAFLQAGLGVLQHFTGSFGANFISDRGYLGILGLGSGRVWHAGGTLGAFNIFANYLALSLCLALPFVFEKDSPRRLWIMAGIILAGFIFTYSRGGLLGFTGAFLFIAGHKLPKKVFLASLIIVALAGGFMAARAVKNYYYAETMGYAGRKEIWSRPWSVITQNAGTFLLGTGTNTYGLVVPYPPDVPPEQRNLWFAHNYYILAWQSRGLIGVALFLILGITAIVRGAGNHLREDWFSANLKAGAAAVFIVSLLHGFFDHAFDLVPISNLVYLTLALSEGR